MIFKSKRLLAIAATFTFMLICSIFLVACQQGEEKKNIELLYNGDHYIFAVNDRNTFSIEYADDLSLNISDFQVKVNLEDSGNSFVLPATDSDISFAVYSVSTTPDGEQQELFDTTQNVQIGTYIVEYAYKNLYKDSLRIVVDKFFPVMTIETENRSAIESKETYLTCLIDISNTESAYALSSESARIRGRGNSTWGMPKKPYKIKFDSKVNLFGFGKAKEYTLIANYCDKSLSRNFFALEIANMIGIDGTSSAQPINLYLNGTYQGVYLLCEQNEAGTNRVNIDTSLDQVDTGYLLELDAYAVNEGIENIDYFLINSVPYAIKEPSTSKEEFTQEHVSFIKDYLTDVYNSLGQDSYEDIASQMDMESFAKCYIVHELFSCVDIGYSSFYMYKVGGGKLYAGPVWDFDISSGNCNYVAEVNNAQILFAKTRNPWYNKLFTYSEFTALVKSILQEYSDQINDKIEELTDYQLEHKFNNEKNFDAWSILTIYVYPNPSTILAIKTFEGQLLFLQNWLQQKLAFMIASYS